MTAVYLNEMGIVCSLGTGRNSVANALFASSPGGLSRTDRYSPGRELLLGQVLATLPSLDALPAPLRGRNNALIELALAEIRAAIDVAIDRYGHHRVAIVLGTSTSGVGESEYANRHRMSRGHWPGDFHYGQQEMGAPAEFLSHRLSLCGPAHVVSTACSSGAKALAAGARLLLSGAADAVIAGGADSLCGFTVAGFSALESVSSDRCNPFSANRRGINIGEGAALFLMTREPGAVRLAGWGETSDAHHMSAPDPSGRGARDAIAQALDRAGIGSRAIDYVNLHGTATMQNDAMESAAVAAILGGDVPCSSTKPLTGHALGAAGALEAAICWLSLADNPDRRMPPHWWDGQHDPGLAPVRLVMADERFASSPEYLLSQNFAFGGSNAALVFGRH